MLYDKAGKPLDLDSVPVGMVLVRTKEGWVGGLDDVDRCLPRHMVCSIPTRPHVAGWCRCVWCRA